MSITQRLGKKTIYGWALGKQLNHHRYKDLHRGMHGGASIVGGLNIGERLQPEMDIYKRTVRHKSRRAGPLGIGLYALGRNYNRMERKKCLRP